MFIQATNVFCMSSHRFVFITPEGISNPASFFSESHHSFTAQCSFTDTFETQASNIYDCSFAKSEKYSSSEVLLSSVQLFSSSEALFINSDFDILVMKLVLSSKSFLSSLSLIDIFVGIAKPCTQLHPAPSPPTTTQLHPPPPGLFCLQSQHCKNQNIARNWTISQNIGQKIQS